MVQTVNTNKEGFATNHALRPVASCCTWNRLGPPCQGIQLVICEGLVAESSQSPCSFLLLGMGQPNEETTGQWWMQIPDLDS